MGLALGQADHPLESTRFVASIGNGGRRQRTSVISGKIYWKRANYAVAGRIPNPE